MSRESFELVWFALLRETDDLFCLFCIDLMRFSLVVPYRDDKDASHYFERSFMIGGERGTGDGLREKRANLTDPKEPVAILAEAGKR